jgi:hypothetical protein
MTQAICTDVYDKDGNLLRIEAYDMTGSHLLDIVWDDSDEQTSAKREEFRKFVYRVLKQKGYSI